MKNNIINAIKNDYIFSRLQQFSNFKDEIFVVGGFLRDAALNKKASVDRDIIVDKNCDVLNFAQEIAKIFDGNYSFFNIYRSLKKLWDEYIILELPDMNFSYIELLLQFDELPDESKKEKIRHDFATIENKNTSIAEKMQDSITVIAHYSYDLPKYVPKKDLK